MEALAPDALPHVTMPLPGPQSRAALARLKLHESPNVTAVAPDFPIVWQQARGSAVRDVDGQVYVDATSAFGVALIGHTHPRVVAAVQAQAAQLLHGMGDVHPPEVRIALLEALADVAPGDLGHGVLCGGGSEAVEVALKTAVLATGKPGVIAFSGSYHGLGHGALDATSRRDFRTPFLAQLAHNTVWLPFPDMRRPPVGVQPSDVLAHTLERITQLVAHPAMGGAPIGAILVEPIQGRGGVMLPPPGFLRALRSLCDRHGVLLILDEIFTGFGRTGTLFACETDAVVPDLLCVGKAMGGGLAIAACLGRPHVMAAWPMAVSEALHTSTFLGHPLACAGALATLAVLRDEDVVARVQHEGQAWEAELRAALGGHAWVQEIRGRGLMWGVELVDPRSGAPAGGPAWQVVTHALQRGVIVLSCGVYGHVLQLTPPVGTTPAQRACVIGAVRAGLVHATETP